MCNKYRADNLHSSFCIGALCAALHVWCVLWKKIFIHSKVGFLAFARSSASKWQCSEPVWVVWRTTASDICYKDRLSLLQKVQGQLHENLKARVRDLAGSNKPGTVLQTSGLKNRKIKPIFQGPWEKSNYFQGWLEREPISSASTLQLHFTSLNVLAGARYVLVYK